MKLMDSSSLEKLSISERKEYYEHLRLLCLNAHSDHLNVGQDIIKKVYPFFRKYEIEIQGEENIPRDSNVIFVVNHSNSHDIFTAYEFLSKLDRKGSAMVATDCLNPITTGIFKVSNATLLDRRKKEERRKSVFLLSEKIISGCDGVIFGEGTWNLHPILPMHNIQNGAANIALITQVPIIPTIVEYVEVDYPVSSEGKLFSKCIIRFGEPIFESYDTSLISYSGIVRERMTSIRKQIWRDYGINKESIDEIDPLLYVNHTYVKKFKALGFTYNSASEQNFILFDHGLSENEYTITEEGEFKPGITEKGYELRKTLR